MPGCCKQGGSNLDRLIIPPTWSKAYDTPFLDIWKKAYEHLTTATCLIIIGYSLPPTDQFFRFFLLSALAARERPLDRVVVVDKAHRSQEKDGIYNRWTFLERFLIPKEKILYHFAGFEVALDQL